jgi:hypothetical protein
MKKKIIDRTRIRRVPPQFSWVDHRLIRYRLLSGRSSQAWALYLLLTTVADSDGISYYSNASLCEHLQIATAQLQSARRELVEANLIAWDAPFYQVLALETRAPSQTRSDAGDSAATPKRANEPRDLAAVLGDILKGGAR